MILGSKPLADMTEEEMIAAMEELRSSREALRNEAIKQKKERDASGIGEPKVRKEKKVKEVDPFEADMLAFLKGEKEDI